MRRKTKRNGFYYKDGKEYVSVTKVLGDVLNKPALSRWLKNEVAKLALKGDFDTHEEVVAQFDLNLRNAQERGKYVHSIAEIMPNIDIDKIDNNYVNYIKALQSWWNTFKPETVSNEQEVYSDELMIAGRYDKIVKLNDENWLIDIKTGKYIYKEVGIQLVAYKHMINQYNIDKTGVLLLMDTGEYQFKETKDTIEEFKQVLSVWHWTQKKGD